jgi:hypothetical protein
VGVVGDILSLDEQADRVVIPNMQVDGVGLAVLNEHICFCLGKQVESRPVVLSWIIVGVHVVIVRFDDGFPLGGEELHTGIVILEYLFVYMEIVDEIKGTV